MLVNKLQDLSVQVFKNIFTVETVKRGEVEAKSETWRVLTIIRENNTTYYLLLWLRILHEYESTKYGTTSWCEMNSTVWEQLCTTAQYPVDQITEAVWHSSRYVLPLKGPPYGNTVCVCLPDVILSSFFILPWEHTGCPGTVRVQLSFSFEKLLSPWPFYSQLTTKTVKCTLQHGQNNIYKNTEWMFA